MFRRTATFGALVSFGILANIVALNFCYEVPLKLYSTNLLLMAAFITAPDAMRLTNVLVLNRPAPAADLSAPHFKRRRAQIAATIVWILFVGQELFVQILGGWQQTTYQRPTSRDFPLNSRGFHWIQEFNR